VDRAEMPVTIGDARRPESKFSVSSN